MLGIQHGFFYTCEEGGWPARACAVFLIKVCFGVCQWAFLVTCGCLYVFVSKVFLCFFDWLLMEVDFSLI